MTQQYDETLLNEDEIDWEDVSSHGIVHLVMKDGSHRFPPKNWSNPMKGFTATLISTNGIDLL